MAGTKYGSFAVGDANIDNVMLQLAGVETGYCALTLTNMTSTAVPQIAAGSKIEVGGSLFKFDANETITGSATTGTNYIRLVPSGSSITAAWTTTAPTWSDSKQGWYDSTGAYRYWPGHVVGVASAPLDYNKYTWVSERAGINGATNNHLANRVYMPAATVSGEMSAGRLTCAGNLYSSPITAFSFNPLTTTNFVVSYPCTVASTRNGVFMVYYGTSSIALATSSEWVTLMPGKYRFDNNINATGTMYITGVFGYAATSSTPASTIITVV